MVEIWSAIIVGEAPEDKTINDIKEYELVENRLTKIVGALDNHRKRYTEMGEKLTESQERVDELEKALRESVMVAIDRDLEVNAGRMDAEQKVISVYNLNALK